MLIIITNKQLLFLLLLLLLLLLLSIRILLIRFTCPPTIYFKFITSLLRQLILLQSTTILFQSATCIYSSKQSFSSNQVNDQLTYSLLHYRKVQPVTLYELTSR